MCPWGSQGVRGPVLVLSAYSTETTFLTETELDSLARLDGKQVPMSLLTQEWDSRSRWLRMLGNQHAVTTERRRPRADFLRVFETLVRGMSQLQKWVMNMDAFLCPPFGMRERSCQ